MGSDLLAMRECDDYKYRILVANQHRGVRLLWFGLSPKILEVKNEATKKEEEAFGDVSKVSQN